MSIKCVRIAVLICFTVLATLTFTQGSADETDAGRSDHSSVRLDRSADSVDPKRLFLAGEDTPVWVAYYANPKYKDLLTYEKLEKGIVKQAIDHWKSNEFNGISKRKRSVDYYMHLSKADNESFAERETMNDVRSPISRGRERLKREINWTVYRPSVLAVMEYGDTWPSDKSAERKLILERIIYALAYWNSVDIQLRPIENPWVRLRLAGIVIGRDRDDTHHVFETYSRADYLHYEGTLQRMVEYWGEKMRQKVDFQRGTYNIVALMTDAKPVPEKEVVAISTNDLPCNHDKPGATGVLITYDDLKFSALGETFRLTANILGHGSDKYNSCAYKKYWKHRGWGACDLDSIRTSLDSKGWCMKALQAFHPPGNPIETILPGSILSWNQQCEAIGSKAGNLCPGSSCYALRCEAREFGGNPCEFWHPLMDGSICGTDRVSCGGVLTLPTELLTKDRALVVLTGGANSICLNAECVSNKRLGNDDWWMNHYEGEHFR